MNLKTIFATLAVAFVTVRADVKHDNSRKCNQMNGLFLEARDDPSDTRYGCLAPKQYGDDQNKFCGGYDGMQLCYIPELGNINYCNMSSWEYNSRGCNLGVNYLYHNVMNDDKKHQSSEITCIQKGGIFLENEHDITDFRFACLLPKKRNDEKSKYCATYDGKSVCYEPDLGNISYCDKKNMNYNSRGCYLGLGYLYDMKRFEDEKRNESKKSCSRKGGYYLENPEEPTDKRFACLLPKKNGDDKNKYCVTYDEIPLCYSPDLSNIDYCDYDSLDFNSRGCALGLGYLWRFKQH